MKFDELFEHRSLVASKLKDCIRDMGYTKVSFAAKADISRPTLDKLLNGSIDSKSSFDRHLQKILKLLNMTVEDLMLYHSTASNLLTATVYSMERVVNFLKEAEIYYLATVEGDQPKVRPFGTVHVFEGKLYIQTGKVKDVSKQIHANPKVEICAFKNGEWLRVAGELVEDDRREARQSMLDAYPSLQKMYSADDGNTEVFYFKNATATFSSFTHEPEVVKF